MFKILVTVHVWASGEYMTSNVIEFEFRDVALQAIANIQKSNVNQKFFSQAVALF